MADGNVDLSLLDGLPVNGFDFPSWEVSCSSRDRSHSSIDGMCLALLPDDQLEPPAGPLWMTG